MGFLKPFLPLSSAAVFDKCMEEDFFDQFLMEQLIYIYRHSDLDVFQLGANEQINQIICAFNVISERYAALEITNLPEHIEHIIINLVHFSMSLWFSLEWQVCDLYKRCHLLQTLFRLESIFSKVPHLKSINWTYLKDLGTQPWKNLYFKRYSVLDKNIEETMSTGTATTAIVPQTEEDIQEQANEEDIEILRQEGLLITLLRLNKMFDAGGMDAVKSFSIRILSAWNQLQQQNCLNDVHTEAKRCLNMICHIYMMSVYEKDNYNGYDIDNLVNDVRFYHKTIIDWQQNSNAIDEEFHKIIKTPAALIALTSVKMKQSFQDLTESVMNELVRESSNTRFGAVSHSYITYLLANILADFNKQDDEDFDANIEIYKRLLHVYVNEREKSERFALEESRKRKLLNTSCNITPNVKEIYNYKAAIGKGNRRSNLINEKSNSAYLYDIENEKRYDPVFQTMPYNKTLTNEFYKILSQSNYKGWQYARLVLLLKIIDRELKAYNNWCYHPGLSTEFMLNLESTLAERFIDLAHIFERHMFIEQEFWLTAFYFRPDEYLFSKVTFCGSRYLRTVNYLTKGCLNEMMVKSGDRSSGSNNHHNAAAAADSGTFTGDAEEGNSCAFMNAKYGLLSSTFDVKQIANMTKKETAQNDYADLSKALRTLRLPENIIKDILTVTFSGRHATYTWAADWATLRKRCKALYLSPELKRKLVESNMAEANDRLKYLKIDYRKYQNLPQLDYGTIEEGYEGAYTNEGHKDDLEDSDSDDSDDSAERLENRNSKRKVVVGRQTKNSTKDLLEPPVIEPEKVDTSETEKSDEAEVPDFNSLGNNPNKRNSARRAAAVIASAMLREDFHSKAAMKKKDEQQSSSSSVDDNNENNDTVQNKIPPEKLPVTETVVSSIETETENATTNKIFNNKFLNISDFWTKNAKQTVAEQRSESFQDPDANKSFLSQLFDKLGDEIYDEQSAESDDESYEISKSKATNTNKTGMELYDEIRKEAEILSVTVLKTPTIEQQQNIQTTTAKQIAFPMEIAESTLLKSTTSTTTTNSKQSNSMLITTNSANSMETLPSTLDTTTKPLSMNTTTLIPTTMTPATITETLTTTTIAATTTADIKPLTKTRTSNDNNCADYDDIINSTVLKSGSKSSPNDLDNEKNNLDEQKVVKPIDRPMENDILNNQIIESETTTTTKAISDAETRIEKTTTTETATTQSQSICIDNDIKSKQIESSEIINENTNTDDDMKDEANHVANDETSSQSSTTINSATEQKPSLEEKKRIQQAMIEKLFKRKCFVKIKRTCMKAYEGSKRLPTVRLKRMDMQKYLEESSRSRSTSKSNSFDSEENSSNPTPAVPSTRRSSRKRRQTSLKATPEEESAWFSSEEEYIPKKTKKRSQPMLPVSSLVTISRSSSSSSSISTTTKKMNAKKINKNQTTTSSLFRSMQHRNRQGRNFSVVPRSASGMKVCISSSSLRDVKPPNECIEILSSDDDNDDDDDDDDDEEEEDDELGGNDDNTQETLQCPIQFANVSMPVADFAQFEVEEI